MELVTATEAALDNGDILQLPKPVHYYYITTPEEAVSVIDLLEPSCSDENFFLAIDVETTGFCPFSKDILLLQLGIASNDGIQYVFDIRSLTKLGFDTNQLRRVLECPCWKVGHNLKFDAKFIKYKWRIELSHFFDTFLAEKVIGGGALKKGEYNLSDTAFRYTQKKMTIRKRGYGVDDDDEVENAKKLMQRSFLRVEEDQPFSAAQLAYAASDVSIVFPLMEEQLKKLLYNRPNTLYEQEYRQIKDPKTRNYFLNFYPEKNNLWNAARLEFQFCEVVVDMELAGTGFSLDIHEEVMGYVQDDYNYYRMEFLKALVENPETAVPQKTLFGYACVNPDSPAQVNTALRDYLGITRIVDSTSVEILEELERELPEGSLQKKAVTALVNYRHLSTLIKMFGDELAAKFNKKTGRLHSDINQVVDTGRISVKKPNFTQMPSKISYRNSFNEDGKPKPDFRSCFIAPPGYVLITTDYGGQELRASASVSNEPAMLTAFRENMDLHSFMASQIINVPYPEVMSILKIGKTYDELEEGIVESSQDKIQKALEALGNIPEAKVLHVNGDHPEAFLDKLRQAFGKRYKEYKDARSKAKTANFGTIYGAGPPNLAKQLYVTIEQGQHIYDTVWQTYPRLKAKLDSVGEGAIRYGHSNTVIGRRRRYDHHLKRIYLINQETEPERVRYWAKSEGMEFLYTGANPRTGEPNEITYENLDKIKNRIIKKIEGRIKRQAGNHIIQGSCADATKLACVLIRREFKKHNIPGYIIMTVHDETVIEVREEFAQQAKVIIEEQMKQAMSVFFPFVEPVAEGHLSKAWTK